jgi:hypothetical protein
MIGQMPRQLAGQVLTLRCQPPGQTVARVVRSNDQVLNDDVPIAFEPRALRDATLGLDDLLIMDDQLGVLAALVRAGTAGILFSRLAFGLIRLCLLIHFARLEAWALLLALEDPDLLFQQLDPLGLPLRDLTESLDHSQQRLHQRRTFGFRNRRYRKARLHQQV